MTPKGKMELPGPVTQFLRDLDGALGDRLVGAILFGSRSNDRAEAESDLDLAIIVSDIDSDRSRQEAFRVLGMTGIDPKTLALSVETYMRLKEFLKLGDPFAWVVCSEGRILKERDALLSELQMQCRTSAEELDSAEVTRYLQGKSYTHYAQAMQALHQFLSNIQLSMMAGAQTVAAHLSKGKVKGSDLVAMVDWANLKSVLQETSATKREIETVEQLIMAHKHARNEDADFPAREMTTMIRTAGELWKRLLPPEGKGGS
jgi:hypothetical protein